MIFGIAAGLVAATAMMCTWATAYLQSDVVQDPKLRTEAVVADGPYRYVRNPLYFANVLMALSMATLASRSGWLLIVVAMTIFQYRLIGREEAELLRRQGDRYRAYLDAVPRLFPPGFVRGCLPAIGNHVGNKRGLQRRFSSGDSPSRWQHSRRLSTSFTFT